MLSATVVFGQDSELSSAGTLWEDTAINPHDFTDDYYQANGILPNAIIARRNGKDGLSVFSGSSNPFHTNVRVTATIPAYDQNGNMLFWYPLGELQEYGFTPDKSGMRARETAQRFPIYIFPKRTIVDFRTFADTRQAALMDNRWAEENGQKDRNPLGLRLVVVVNYTSKAFQKEGFEMMQYLMKKNGAAADHTPIIRSTDDLTMLLKDGLVETMPMKEFTARYTLGPTIDDPTRGAIAPDAFLWMATNEDRHLPAEDAFVWQFHCLQKTGNWCQ
jgi:hypothetical protein